MSYLKKVLIIDDEENITFFVKQNLEKTGEFSVFTANSGRDGLVLAKLEKPDIILLDIVMPEMEGPDVAEALLKNPVTSNIPIVFLTAIVNKDEVGGQDMGEIGGRTYIAKPIKTDRLIACIRKALAQAKRK